MYIGKFAIVVGFILVFALLSCTKSSKETVSAFDINKVNHVIVIYMENHSFDNLYGEFPGANGLANAAASQTQIDTVTGQPYPVLPWSDNTHFNPPPAFPNKPFNIGAYVPPGAATNDLVHRYYQEQVQIDGGKMDKFAVISDAKGLTMGHYHTAQLPMFPIVQQYTLCDNFFHSAFGGSFLNHFFFIAAAPPVFQNAPDNLVAKGGIISPNGAINDGAVTPDGYGINTLQSVNSPHYNKTPKEELCPKQTMPTIGDRLSEKGISWVWYTGKWNVMLSGNATHADSSLFQFHHQPFVYFAKYADSTPAKAEHLKDETEFMAALEKGSLPAVSFVKPYGIDNEHPGYTDLLTGENHLVSLVNQIKASPIWKDCLVIVTYDEHGGFWDHVAPPVIDKWGPGCRVPGIIISPFAKNGFVDHTQYETESILAFIEKRWGLQPLGTRDKGANPFSNAFKD
jgi:phospholipase C